MGTKARKKATKIERRADALSLEARVEAAARQVVADLGDLIRALFDAQGAGAEWYSQETSPLGRRKHCRLARAGVLPARKAGRAWLVRRRDLDAYLETHGTPNPDAETPERVFRRVVGA